MPNDCSNNLYIWGDEQELQEFVKAVKTDSGYKIIHSIYPCPQELRDTRSGFCVGDEQKQAELNAQHESNCAKYGYADWYDWCNENWGTKWGDYDTDLSVEDTGYRSFYFNSAWSPPEKAFAHISTMYPNLKFVLSYDEMGNGFAGASSYHAGLVATSYTEDILVEGCEDGNDLPIDDLWDRLDTAYIEAREACEDEVRNAIGV